jgi:hypothetical protein
MAKTLELTLLKALYNSHALKTLSHQVFGEVDIDRFCGDDHADDSNW